MAQAEIIDEAADQPAPAQTALEGQTYEIIRKRLAASGEQLRARLDQLNEARKEVFGSIETALLHTERVTTDNNCEPRDIVNFGGRMLLGYNVQFGLRTEIKLADVFASYEFTGDAFDPLSLEWIADPQFEKDFADLYKYYKHTRFARFAVRGPHLFMVFRIGAGVDDIKTFKWVIEGDQLRYLDNRSDHQFQYPPQHDFEWIATTRDDQRAGMHPHVSIQDRLFVETVGGDLTIKIENNTASGEGIYSEDVEHKDQTLDDADIQYAIVGNIIVVRVRPYQEKDYRYIVYNEKLQEARRLDAIADSCVLLPDDHGLIFPGGYYLQTGENKTFNSGLEDMVFEKQIRAANGEDFLYVFLNRIEGAYLLLSYNLIAQEVATPVVTNGFAFCEDGALFTFRHNNEPQKHHAIQIWRTPYVGVDFVPHAKTDSLLFKIGNRDLVRGMAECHEVLALINKEDTYANLYLDIVKRATGLVDSYFWLDNDEAFHLREVLVEIRETADGAINEFEKVIRVKRNTREEVARVTDRVNKAVSTIRGERFEEIGGFVRSLAELRAARGDVISLRELRYVDSAAIDALEATVREHSDELAQRCVDFLLEPESLAPYEKRVNAEHAGIAELTKVAVAREVEERVDAAASELEMLIEIVSNLKIDDATQRTAIIDNISTIFSRLNQTRSALKGKTHELMLVEGAAEFHSGLKLLNQSVVNYLDVCDSPQKCEEYLTKVMIQIEEMEGRFAEFDDFVEQLSEKRDEVYNAFEARRLALVEARNRRAGSLMKSAERILKGCKTRVESLKTVSEINGYFASDLMVEKVRDIVEQLDELGDSVKVDDIQSRLKTTREDAVRQLKDRQELFVDGQNIIQFGRHKFSVNVQNLDLTSVLRDDSLCYHLTGTNFFERIDDEQLLSAREAWDQEVVSETPQVYRAEYLAYLILQSLGEGDAPTLDELLAMTIEARQNYIQKFMGPRYAEGYVKGVHDHDAQLILHAAAQLRAAIGLLRYRSPARALACLYWKQWNDKAQKPLLTGRVRGFGVIGELFPEATTQAECVTQLSELLRAFVAETAITSPQYLDEAAEYLFHVLAREEGFTISREANDLLHEFRGHLESKAFAGQFAESLTGVQGHALSAFRLARDWVRAYLQEQDDAERTEFIDETALLLLEEEFDESRVIHTPVSTELEGLVGTHAVITGGKYRLRYNDWIGRLGNFARVVVPRYQQFTHRRHELVDQMRDELRLDEFRPRVLTSFVRNKLIDKVYLPLTGDNLAKQIGVAGEAKRTDRMGLLLLISPPGYGKTTLMEYIANRLGIIFMKINGPAIGRQVTSLDPTEAPNAAAREEVEKLNLALEMGDNVMIYLDDIQHCNPELLQKFISLCDATRKIEGVYKGKTRTYDLRGRKVCVVMAGNPYTESGEKFQIPDMLANRADTYNLGEIIGDNRDVFEMSYLENSLTSNPTLSNLGSKSPNDIYGIIKMAQTGANDPVDLEGNYSLDELSELVETMKKLMRVRDVVLRVNRAYIRSAAQQDEYRTEPAFKLQGSYRNMNRIAEKISPIMNDDELETLIYSAYENDAQTLTSGAEANLLKFKDLAGTLTDEEAKRWAEICRKFQENLRFRGVGADDKFGQVIAQMGVFSDGLASIREALSDAATQMAGPDASQDQLVAAVSHLGQFGGALDAIRKTLGSGVKQLGSSAGSQELTATFSPEATAALAEIASQIKTAQQQAEEAPPVKHQIQITNKVPRTILAVIREQFKLMEGWMKPLAESGMQQSQAVRQLRAQLTQAMSKYEDLLGEMEEDEE
jgi:hypothetical protein